MVDKKLDDILWKPLRGGVIFASTHIIEEPYLELVAGGFHVFVPMCEYACNFIRLGIDPGTLKRL